MAAVLGTRPALSRTANILVVGAGHAGIREARDLLLAHEGFHSNGARSIGHALASIAHGNFDAILVDDRTWDDRANGIQEAVATAPPLGVVVLGGPGQETSGNGVVIVPDREALDGAMLSRALMLAIDAAREQRRRATMVRWLERESSTDPVSGLHNARSFNQSLREACSIPGKEVGVVLLNVVGTGMVNHNYGRETSDRMLRHAAMGIGRSIRANDLAARLTDDTFAVLIREADMDLCRRIGRRIVQELSRANATAWRGDIPVTVTVGMACGQDCTAEDLLTTARRQLTRNRPFMPAPPALESIGDDPSVA